MTSPPEPPPSWSELAARLQELLERASAPGSRSGGRRAAEVAAAWVESAVARAQQVDVAPPSEPHRQLLIRSLCSAGHLLAASGEELQPSTSRRAAPLCNPVYAGHVLIGCAALAAACSMPLSDVRELAGGLALVLRGGAAAMEPLVAGVVAAHDQVAAARHVFVGLGTQIQAVRAILVLLSDVERRSALSGFLQASPLAHLLPRWLDAVIQSLLQLRSIVPSGPDFGPLLEAESQGSAARAGRLVTLLQPILCAASVALRLPRDRRPQWCTAQAASDVAAVLAVLVAQAAPEALAHDHARGIGTGGSDLGQLLQAAAQLVQHLDSEELSGSSARQHDPYALFSLLGNAACMYRGFGRPLAQPQQLQQAAALASALLAALPKFAHPLQFSAAPDLIQAAGLSLVRVLQLLGSFPGRPEAQHCILRTLPEWCAGASAALRLLPAVEQAAQQAHRTQQGAAAAGGQQSGQQANDVVATLTGAAQHIATLASNLLGLCHSAFPWHSAVSGRSPASTGVPHSGLPAAQPALWQLHSACCRAVHWGQLQKRHVAPDLAEAAALLASSALSAASKWQGLSSEPSSAAAQLALRAMAAAHFEALAAALPRWQAEEVSWAGSAFHCITASLARAAAWLPHSLVAQPVAQSMLTQLLGRLPAERDDRAEAFDELLAAAEHCPPVTAHLLACGALSAGLSSPACPAATAAAGARALAVLAEAGKAAAAAADDGSAAATVEAIQQRADALAAALAAPAPGSGQPTASAATLLSANVLQPASLLAVALLEWFRRPEAQRADALDLARVASARSCANLRCANLAGEGGPAAGQGAGSLKCSACRAVWYCNETCSHAEWRGPGGHRRVCRALGAERAAARAAARLGEGQPGAGGSA